VRKKIEEGRKKFKQYKNREEPCVLVLCHHGIEPIVLDAISIFGSMLGNLATAIPINPDTGVGDASQTHIMFTNGGKMIHQTTKNSVRVQNTTISAVAVLETIRVRYRRVYIALRRRKAMEGRDFTPEELLTVWRELYSADQSVEDEPRIVVYDNLEPAVPLPREFPGGPYDERFGIYNDRLCRTYVGAELAAIEKEEKEVRIRPDDPLCLRT